LFAFSANNWQRPSGEVGAIMQLLRRYLRRDTDRCIERGIRVSVIGRRDRLSSGIVLGIRRIEHATQTCRRLHLRIAVDYSAREAIAYALRQAVPSGVAGQSPLLPDVDLLIRTGGEQRLSDFLLWECAYAELYFTERMWPEFDATDLDAALTEFRRRERRFGR